MGYKVSLSTQAKADIQTAYSYIHEHSPQAAERWFQLLLSEMQSLKEMPGRCAIVPEASKLEFEMRHLLYGKRPGIYRIVFRILEDNQEVHILTVRHGARKPLTGEDVQPFLELP